MRKPRPIAGAFAGMNRTDAGIRVEAERRRSQAKVERTTRAASPHRSRKGKNERQPGAMKALRMQQSLTQVSYGQRSQVKSRINEIKAFEAFELLPTIQQSIPEEALQGMVDIKPTPIQRLAIPALLGTGEKKMRRSKEMGDSKEMKQFLLAAETGSGKTLAYLLPTIDAIKRAEAVEKEEEAKEQATKDEERQRKNSFELDSPPLSGEENLDAGRPRAIILLPTSELVDQVGRLFKTFSHVVKYRVAIISAAYTATVIRNRLFAPHGVDVVISTPHLLNSIATTTPNVLSRVTHLVADEADSLFDRSFAPLTSAIIDRASPSLRQLILCSATIPRSLDSYLRNRFPDITRLTTPNLHAIPRRVQMSVVDIDKDPYNSNRDLACADTIWNIGSSAGGAAADDDDAMANPNDVKRVLVFVNEREKAQELAAYLNTKGIDAAALNRDTTEHRGSEILDAFTSTTPKLVSKGGVLEASRPPTVRTADGSVVKPNVRMLPRMKVLVMTDLGSRGIDTVAVRHVVLYDVPHTTIDFIHRL